MIRGASCGETRKRVRWNLKQGLRGLDGVGYSRWTVEGAIRVHRLRSRRSPAPQQHSTMEDRRGTERQHHEAEGRCVDEQRQSPCMERGSIIFARIKPASCVRACMSFPPFSPFEDMASTRLQRPIIDSSQSHSPVGSIPLNAQHAAPTASSTRARVSLKTHHRYTRQERCLGCQQKGRKGDRACSARCQASLIACVVVIDFLHPYLALTRIGAACPFVQHLVVNSLLRPPPSSASPRLSCTLSTSFSSTHAIRNRPCSRWTPLTTLPLKRAAGTLPG